MGEGTFADRLKRARGLKGWTQKRLADELGVVQQVISRYEVGQHIPQLGIVKVLADVLGTTVDYLAGTGVAGRVLHCKLSERGMDLLKDYHDFLLSRGYEGV
jgi:transcriptional regulator with XRE-family HTH domain